VGATQDLAALDIDLAAITQAGGWKSTRMPLQYAEKDQCGKIGYGESGRESWEGFDCVKGMTDETPSTGESAPE
jgi:hypothetical protein